LFFIPVYLKNNPLQEYHAACFNMDQKHCNSFIHVLHPILEQCLHNADVMPAETQKEFGTLLKEQQREDEIPILLHDGTEREMLVQMSNGKIIAERKRSTRSKMRLLLPLVV
jgi:hypothetical protein